MVTTKRRMWTSLLIAVFAVAALGCASSGTPKAIGPNDLAASWS